MKTILKTLFRIFIVCATLFTGYYFLILSPALQGPREILDIEKTLAKHHTNLLNARLAFTELTRLDPTTPDFVDEKSRALGRLESSISSELELINESEVLPKISEFSLDTLDFINETIPTEFSNVSSETQTILVKIQNTINTFKALDAALTDIYAYNPVADLWYLDLNDPNERNEFIGRVNAAKEGLAFINQQLRSLDANGTLAVIQTTELQTKIDQALQQLQAIVNQINADQIDEAIAQREQTVNSLVELKDEAYQTQLSIINNPQTIQSITDLTNAILQYEFLLENIQQLLTELREEN